MAIWAIKQPTTWFNKQKTIARSCKPSSSKTRYMMR